MTCLDLSSKEVKHFMNRLSQLHVLNGILLHELLEGPIP